MKLSRVKIYTLVLMIFLLSLITYLPDRIYALDASGSGNLIQQKLDELKISIASRAAKIKEDLSKRLQNKVLVGPVLSIDSQSIQISNEDEVRNISTNEYTDFPKTKIVIGDYLIALGEIDDKNSLVARKVLVSLPPPELETKIIWGQILSVQKDLLKFKAKEATLSALLLDKNTLITSPTKDLTLSDIKEGTIVVAIGTQKADLLQTRFIDVIANKTLKLPKGATATQSATPAATKKK